MELDFIFKDLIENMDGNMLSYDIIGYYFSPIMQPCLHYKKSYFKGRDDHLEENS